MKVFEKFIFPSLLLALLAVSPDVVEAQGVCNKNPDHPKCQPDPNPEPDPDPGDPFAWMHPDVGVAHDLGFKGFGSHMITVDSFSGTTYSGNLDGTTQSLTHGEWTYFQSHLVAPFATREYLDHNDNAGSLVSASYKAISGVNAVNLSFGLFDPAGTNVNDPNYSLGTKLWDSLVDEAHLGTAVFVKAAGNTNGGTVDGTVRMRLGGFRPTDAQDVLNLSLIGAQGALFVGALDGNGTTSSPASIASYSTVAGGDPSIQAMFLVAGVEDNLTNLAGTSFAAPIVTGYAAIIGDKFETAAPAEVVDQLLLTARKDTVSGYSLSIHGQGEACLSCALSPDVIPE